MVSKMDCEAWLMQYGDPEFKKGLMAAGSQEKRMAFAVKYLEDLSQKQVDEMIGVQKFEAFWGYTNRAVERLSESDTFIKATDKAKAKMIRTQAWDSAQKYIAGGGTRTDDGITPLDMAVDGEVSVMVSKVAGFLEDNRIGIMGLRDSKEAGEDLIRLILGTQYGEQILHSSGKSLAKLRETAKVWQKEILDYTVEELNGLGVPLNKLDEYGLRMTHDSEKVAAGTFDDWFGYIQENKIFKYNFDYDGPDELRAIMETIYWNIASEGSRDVKYGQRITGSFSESFEKHRKLQPMNGDKYLKYKADYGSNSGVVDDMLDYAHSAGRRIGVARTLGPKPDDTMNTMISQLTKSYGDAYVRRGILESSYDHVIGKNLGFRDGIGKGLQAARALQVILKLGGTPLTALSDVYYGAFARMYLGMPVMNSFKSAVRAMNPLDDGDRLFAAKLGLVFEDLSRAATDVNRSGEIAGYDLLSRVTQGSTRISGLAGWTNKSKRIFALEMSSNFGHYADQGMDTLPPALQDAFARYGFTPDEWDLLRGTAIDRVWQKQSVKFIDPQADELPRELAAKYVGMIRRETQFAVPEADIRARASLTMGAKPGTFPYAFIQTMGQFKAFGVAIMQTHMARAMDTSTNGHINKSLYRASTMLAGMATGYSILALKDIANGKTPRMPTDPAEIGRLALDSIAQTGMLGLAGDFALRDPEAFGGMPSYAIGPTASDAFKLGSYMMSPDKWLDGKKVMVDGIDMADQLIFPGNLWYLKKLTDRLIWDNVKGWVDPVGQRRKKAAYRKFLNEQGQRQMLD